MFRVGELPRELLPGQLVLVSCTVMLGLSSDGYVFQPGVSRRLSVTVPWPHFQLTTVTLPAEQADAFVMTLFTVGGVNQLDGASRVSCAKFKHPSKERYTYLGDAGMSVVMEVMNDSYNSRLPFAATLLGHRYLLLPAQLWSVSP